LIYEATMTTRGRVTIPKRLRDAMGWQPQDKLEWLVSGGEVTISKLETASSIEVRNVDKVLAVSEGGRRGIDDPTEKSF
jgi:AbrB family looped-hinge helix DNA binding protein